VREGIETCWHPTKREGGELRIERERGCDTSERKETVLKRSKLTLTLTFTMESVKTGSKRGGRNMDKAAHGADNNIEHIILLCLPFLPSRRRLLTQLEAAKGSRAGSAGDSKPTASAKGPDGVVLYELHSRPEQEKFNESAKVKWKGRWRQQSQVSGMNALTK